MADQQPPVEGTEPKVTDSWTELPNPVSGGVPSIIRASNQPGGQASPSLPNLFDMLPDFSSGDSTSRDIMGDFKSPIPYQPNMRALNYIRGANQGLLSTALNTMWVSGSNVGLGIVDGLAFTLDFQSHFDNLLKVEDDYSNWLSNVVEKIRPDPADYIFQKEPGQVRPFDPAFWGGVSADVAYSAGIMAPAVLMAALSRGIINPLVGGSGAASAVGSTLLAGTVQRMGESLMEAKEISNRVYEDAIALGYSEEQARAMRGKAGSTTYNENMKLALLDAIQLGAVFGSVKNLAGLRGNAFNRFLNKNKLTYPFEVITEGGEEGWQFGIGEKAYEGVFRGTYMPEKSILGKSLSMLGDPDMQRAMISGGLGGAVFTAVGPKLKKITQSREYKDFLAENKASLEKLPTNGELEHVKDNKFLDLVFRHANTQSLVKVQDHLDKMAKIPAEQLQKEGTNPEAFYAEVGKRQKQAADIGKLYNDVFGRTKVDPIIKNRMFQNYALKYMLDDKVKRTRGEIDSIVDSELGAGNFTKEGVDEYVNFLTWKYYKDITPQTPYQKDAQEQLIKELIDSSFALSMEKDKFPLVRDVELREKVTELASSIFERRFRDLELKDLEKPEFQKTVIEAVKQAMEAEKKVKEEVKAEVEEIKTKIKASETRAEDLEKGAAAKEKTKIRSPKERKIQEDRIIRTLAENNRDVNSLTKEDRDFYDKSQDAINKKVDLFLENNPDLVEPISKKEPKPPSPAQPPKKAKEGETSIKGSTPEQQATYGNIKGDQELVEERPSGKKDVYVIGGVEHQRVSNVIPEFYEGPKGRGDLALKVGSNIDAIAKDVFEGTAKKKYKGVKKSESDNLIKELTEYKNQEEAKGVVFMSGVIVFDPDLKIAGEVDLIGINPDGSFRIYDFKSSKDFKDFEKNSRKRYSYQLSAYNNLMFRRYGEDAKLLEIIPISIDYESDGNVTIAEVLTHIPITYDPGVEEYVPREDIEEADTSFLDQEREAGIQAFERSPLVSKMKFNDFADYLKSLSQVQIINKLEEKKVIKKDCT